MSDDRPKWEKLGFPSEHDWLLSGYDNPNIYTGIAKAIDAKPLTAKQKHNGQIVDFALIQDPLIPRINPDWMRELQINDKGRISANEYNAGILLTQSPEFSGKIAWDKRTLQPITLFQTPAGSNGAWLDSHTASATLWAQRRGLQIKPKMLEVALLSIATRNPIDPLQEWLHNLEWDGQERLGTWLTTYCGADDNPTNSAIGSKFLIGACARALRPGCRMDYMLVLEGLQGIGKSTVVKILGGQYTAENLPDLHSKDAQQAAGCSWFIEMSELAALRRSDIEQVKAFLTRTEDTFRPPYGRHPVKVKRWCVVVGNVNPSGHAYLFDTTGNRRFWPVKVGKADTAKLRQDRNQLFAEAVYCFNRGDPWWIENDEQRDMVAVAQEEREHIDEWQEACRIWADSRIGSDSFTGLEIATGALQLDVKDVSVSVQMRIAICMKKLGYIKEKRMINGIRNWRYVRPSDEPGLSDLAN